ncbi:hypothetical protein KP509_21G063300 [Ceratopteris richardii]|uniref:Probable glucan 1,3-alpha-glucosidase n=1 Tax=Ceratopteris richardii TaxID=49495 RepID=A0A8T2SC37_CERRI|nr:hypothetical protein KP509_21G063300 [Ceratopteris richardii]
MAYRMPTSTLLLQVFVLVFAARCAYSWRREEFRNCNQTPFCKRARGLKPEETSYEASEVVLVDGHLQGKLFPLSIQEGDPSSPLSMHVFFYSDHIIRLKINELNDPSDGTKRKRFEVPYVIEDSLDEKRLWIQKLVEENGASVVTLASNLKVFLQHKPFQIRIQDGEKCLLSFNSNGLFNFEQLREKKEGDEWEESFRTHTDSRPYGPQSISFDVTFHGAEHVYGIPEHATNLALRPTRGPEITSEPYRLFNLDVFEYIEDSPFGLYGSIPFMLSHSAVRSTGFFWLNSAEMLIDILAPGWEGDDSNKKQELNESDHIDTQWISESGIIDVFFFVGPRPKDLLRQYTTVTGLPVMPQLFATAYHQSRWNYKDEADVYNVDDGFDDNDIPYDVLWLDIEHTDGKRYFTFDHSLFPNPKEMQEKLASKGRHMVTIVDPHIKRDDGFFLHKEATSKGYYVKDIHGRDFDGWCWPGSSSYLDMLNPEIRKWWAEKFSYTNYAGSTPSLYIWNDMNEPSVFNGPEATMPRDCVHHGGIEHRDVHNAYGYYFHMATADGLLQRSGGKDRPFVLSRAFFAGTQKVGAVWTGDNTAEWDHLQVSVPMVLSLGITGLSFIGADVGGFFGNPDPELLTRWYQLAAYYPFFRAHAHLDTKRREPWLFGEPYTSYIRDAIRERYALLPYFYTLFREASMTGVPIMRPLWMEFPDEEMTYTLDRECMVGSSLLVNGVYTQGAHTESVYLPGGLWYELKTGKMFSGGDYFKIPVAMDTIPVFQRGGTIIPRRERPRRSSTQMVNDPYTLLIAVNGTHEAEGELYMDDGNTFDFAEGAFIHRKFIFSQGCLTSVAINSQKSRKKFISSSMIERIVILGLELPITTHATVEPHNRRVELEVGPSLLRSGMQSNAYIIRKPNVLVSEDWLIRVL